MAIRDLQVVVGNEVKISWIIASASVSQSPAVMLLGASYLEGGCIRFPDSEADAKYITAYLPEIANDEDQTPDTFHQVGLCAIDPAGGLKKAGRRTTAVSFEVSMSW